MRKAVIVLSIFLAFQTMAADLRSSEPVRIAVLPFEVFSIGDDTRLGQETAEDLSRRLGVNPSLITADRSRVRSVRQGNDYSDLSLDRLKKIARMLGVRYLVLGSITVIRDDVSMDIQMFSRTKRGIVFKTFAEGTDRTDLIERIALSIEQEITPVPAGRSVPSVPSADEEVPAGDFLDAVLDEPFPPVEEPEPEETPPEMQQQEEVQGLGTSAVQEEDLTGQESEEQTGPVVSDAETALPESPESEPGDEEEKQGPEEAAESREGLKEEQKLFSSDKPININADTMEYDNKNNVAFFRGNVVARQADIVMFANSMKVLYSAKGGVKRVSATGNVRIVQGDRIATGAEMVFYADEQKIVATGNPRVWQGDNVIHGEKITVYIKEDRSVVEGGSGDRASATIYPNR